MLDLGFWHDRSSHIGNGVLLLVMLLFAQYKLYESAINRSLSLHAGFVALTLTPVLDAIDTVSSPVTDLPASLMMLVIAYFLIRACEDFFSPPSQNAIRTAAFRLVTCLLLCAIALTIKLSAAVYGMAACLALLSLWLLKREFCFQYRLRVAAIGGLIVLCTVLLWAARTIILTGYPFFPSLAIAFPVPWRIPNFYAEWYEWWFTTFARMPYNDSISGEGIAWIPAWITVELRKAKIAGVLPLALTTVAWVHLCASRKGREYLRRLLPAWIPVLLALIAWFVSAPSFRFSEALIWILAAQSIVVSLMSLVSVQPRRLNPVIIAICVLPLSAILMHVVLVKQRTKIGVLPALATTLWVSPGPDYGMYRVHETPVNQLLTEGGVTAYEPKMRPPCKDGAFEDCVMWYGPIPGAQRLKSTLAYLSKSDPRAGFRIAETRDQWIATHAADVQRKSKDLNIRQLAYYFQVAPKTIRLALEFNVSQNRSQ
jgi:hypothetical protein